MIGGGEAAATRLHKVKRQQLRLTGGQATIIIIVVPEHQTELLADPSAD